MAAEWWYPPMNMRVRLPVCGHAVLDRDVPATYDHHGEMTLNCPVCDVPQASQFTSKYRDGVPTASLGWGEAQCRQRRKLKAPRASEVRPKSLDGLLAVMSKRTVHQVDLTGASLKLSRKVQDQGPTESLVLRSWPAGCTVTGGTIQLPDFAIVLLTGQGVHFRGTSFVGRGVIVCCGDTFSSTFQDCRFSECSLYAVHGAAATLRHCALSAGCPGIVASGHSTSVTLHSCTLDTCVTAVTAERGATIAQHGCRVQRGRTSIIAHGASTRVSCTDSTFFGIATPENPGTGAGVDIRGAKVSLRRCSMVWYTCGVHVHGITATIELRGCSVLACVAGLVAAEGAAFLLRDTDIQHVCSWGGRPVVDIGECSSGRSGRRSQIERCHLSTPDTVQAGVDVSDGGALAIKLSDVQCAGKCLRVFDRGSTATASHCTLRSDTSATCIVEDEGAVLKLVCGRVVGGRAGAECANGGTLSVRGTELAGSRGDSVESECAVSVQVGGVAKLSQCSLRQVVQGVQIVAGTVTAHNVSISDPAIGQSDGNSFGYVQCGGKVSVRGGYVRGCCAGAVSLEAKLSATETSVTDLDAVLFDGNRIGVHVGEDCSLRATCCVFSGVWKGSFREGSQNRQKMAVLVDEGAGAALLQWCTFRGDDQPVCVHGQQAHEIADCVFMNGKGNAAGCAVTLQGRGTVRDCVFADVRCGVGVLARHCSVTGCHFLPDLEMGLLASGGGVAVSACRFDGCGIGIDAQAGSAVDVADSECAGVETGVNVVGAATVTARRLVTRGGGTAVHVAAKGAAGAAVRLEECQMSGASKRGVVLDDAGSAVTLEGCQIESCYVGMEVMPGGLARVMRTNILRCTAGIAIGTNEEVMGYVCGVCGRSGHAAMTRAWTRLRGAGGTGTASARCMHDGACALATLRDVVIADCGGGVQLHVTGRMDAERLEVRGCMTAYLLTRIGAMSSFRQCLATGGNAPSVVAQRLLAPGTGRYEMEHHAVKGIAVVDEGPPASAEAMAPLIQTGNARLFFE